MKIPRTLNTTASVQSLHYSVDHIVRTVRNNLLIKLHEFQSWNYMVGVIIFFIGFSCKLKKYCHLKQWSLKILLPPN